MQKNENRPGYKKTKIGWIPCDWEAPRLAESCLKIGSGITPRGGEARYLTEGVAFVRSQNIMDGRFNSDGIKFISRTQHEVMNATALQPQDILYNITGASIGRCCVFPGHIGEANVNQHVCIVRLNGGSSPSFVASVLRSHVAKKQLHESQAGGGREGLNFKNLGAYRIPLPSLPEQEAIAEMLESWDSAIRCFGERIEKKRSIKKGLMQQLLSGEQRLPGFSDEWAKVQLGELVDLIKEKVGDRTVVPMSLSSGIGFVPQAEKFGRDISGKQYQNYTLLPRDCFTYNKGNSKRYPQGCIYLLEECDQVAVPNVFISFKMKPSVAVNDFFKQVFLANIHGRELVRYINSGVRNDGLLNLNTTSFLRIRFSLPSIPEQAAIAAVLSKADAELAGLERRLAALKDQKRFLLNNLVTGSLRFPEFRIKNSELGIEEWER